MRYNRSADKEYLAVSKFVVCIWLSKASFLIAELWPSLELDRLA